MPRPLRVEYADALYHVMSRGDRREDIFVDDLDREKFLGLLGRACANTGWDFRRISQKMSCLVGLNR
jgi:putative transposase